MPDLSPELVERFAGTLRASIDAANADAILLSGGLDTSTIAAFAAQRGTTLKAVTVCVRSDAPIDPAHRDLLAGKLGCDPAAFPAPDAAFAEECARTLHFPHDLSLFSLDELLSYAPATVRAIRSFDPMQVRNGITIYIALLRAKALGAKRVFTGDGADEMYAGYSHMWSMPADKLEAYLRHMATIMQFTTPDLAAAVGVETVSPFTERALVDLAFQLPHAAFIGERDGRQMGKWIVRKAVERLLPGSLVWRVKTPIRVRLREHVPWSAPERAHLGFGLRRCAGRVSGTGRHSPARKGAAALLPIVPGDLRPGLGGCGGKGRLPLLRDRG